jgi:hypothetical protein
MLADHLSSERKQTRNRSKGEKHTVNAANRILGKEQLSCDATT